MTHELKHIIKKGLLNQSKGLKSVLASVVYLEGSSYRKPGVRMLIAENGNMTGAVSGGCVEKEIYNQAQTVFKTDVPKVITYDGRYRLGCEGLLYILIEPFFVTKEIEIAFAQFIENRNHISLLSYFKKADEVSSDFGSLLNFGPNIFMSFRNNFIAPTHSDISIFSQNLAPCFKLYIFGAEHDAVKLCTMASLLGWEVHVITSIKDPKLLTDFPGATSVTAQSPDLLDLKLDAETAVVLMNHNYVQDLKYLLKLASLETCYIGILGSVKRREKLIHEVFDHNPEIQSSFVERIYSPAGLDIGSITPEEIALSIVSEILALVRKTNPKSLRSIQGKIHS